MRQTSRRGFAGLALGACAAVAAPQAFAGIRPDSLDGLARAKGLRFGAAVGDRDLADPACRSLILAECGVVVAENQMKWPAVQPSQHTWTFQRGDALASFASQSQIALRGHNLLWHNTQWLPDWVKAYDFGPNPRQAAEQLLGDHIRTEAQHYRGRVISWDVVNETIDDKTGKMRETVFTQAMGPEVIDFAYHTAREALPDTQLVYNDYMRWEPHSAEHRAGVLRLLEGFKKRGVPVDAFGVQSHIGAGDWYGVTSLASAQQREWRAFIDEIVGMGYALLLTEFDVGDNGLPTDIAQRDKAVADYARAYLDLMLSYPQVQQVLTWGLINKNSWLQVRAPRKDGTPKRVLPWDDHYQPTPLREAIADAFRAAPKRG
jgi:endo-1,4-beta-xylanase